MAKRKPPDPERKLLVMLHGEMKSPPLSKSARIEAGTLLSQLQEGEILSLPQSRPMPRIGPRCHELRITDNNKKWRIVYRIDRDAIVISEIFQKTTRQTPKSVIDVSKRRLKTYDQDSG